jgi:hypothetical protein
MKTLGISAATALAGVLVCAGAATAAQRTVVRPNVVIAAAQGTTPAEIRAQVQRSGATLVQLLQAYGGALVETRSGGLLTFTWYDFASGRSYRLPVGPLTEARVVQILGATDITLLNLGSDCDCNYLPFPYELHCSRATTTSAFTCDVEKTYFPVGSAVRFGSKPGEVLTQVTLTLDGVELAFGPEPGKKGEFMADYTSVPPAETGYQSPDVFTLTFQDAVPAAGLAPPSGGNAFLRGVTVRRVGGNLEVDLALKPSVARYYTGDLENEWLQEWSVPFLELRFSDMDFSPVPVH